MKRYFKNPNFEIEGLINGNLRINKRVYTKNQAFKIFPNRKDEILSALDRVEMYKIREKLVTLGIE